MPVVVADFRREYGISLEALQGLHPVEFSILLHGLSAQSRLVMELAQSATVPQVRPPADLDDYVAQLRRHPGINLEVIGGR